MATQDEKNLPDLGVLPPPTDKSRVGKPYNVAGWSANRGQLANSAGDTDPARYIIPPGNFPRPSLVNIGIDKFTWPLGVENFDLNSNAQLGVHHYIGDNDVDVTIIYPIEDHIIVQGIFPGYTGSANMQGLRKVLSEKSPKGRLLHLPQLLNAYVQILNYRFSHDNGDRTRGIAYSVEFIEVASGSAVNPKPPTEVTARPITPTTTATDKGSPSRVYVTSQNVRTLKTVAAAVYNDPDKWQTIFDLNVVQLNATGVPAYAWSYLQLPMGMALAY